MKPNTPQTEEEKAFEAVLLIKANDVALKRAAKWVDSVIERRLLELKKHLVVEGLYEIGDMPVWPEGSTFDTLRRQCKLSEYEMFVLALVYVGQFHPHKISVLWKDLIFYFRLDMAYSKFTKQFSVTLKTALYLLAGENEVEQGFYYMNILNSRLFTDQILLSHEDKEVSIEQQGLRVNDEFYRQLMTGDQPKLEARTEFPAELLETHLSFDDLVLKDSVKEQLDNLMAYIKNQDKLYAQGEFSEKIKSGYVTMLYGPPGTGKTMTVAVMAKELGIDVYCIDLSRVVSKYIGETEKNLEKVFQRLESKRCILLFDEADALFGKRSEVKAANDRYANQEVAYLLQRIEKYPGLVILTSNYNQNLDKAFKRRILTSIYMPAPSADERRLLWKKKIPDNYILQPASLIEDLAKDHLLTGANIANVVKLACIKAHQEQNGNVLNKKIFEPIIKEEQYKEKS